MAVIVFQVVIACSIAITYWFKPKYALWSAWFWTAETVLYVFYPPLIGIQLTVVWGAYFLLSHNKFQRAEITKQRSVIDALHQQLRSHPRPTRDALRRLPANCLKFISGHQHRKVLIGALAKVKKRLYILSGWLGEGVVNAEFLQLAEAALQRGAVVAIGYGWEDSAGGHKESRSSKNAFAKLVRLRNVAESRGYSGHLILARFGNHEKILVKDEDYLVCGSNNGLSNRAFKNSERSVIVSNRTIVKGEAHRVLALIESNAILA